jgi:hypothetical protein
MRLVAPYALGRIAFGLLALIAPGPTAQIFTGSDGATPSAQGFVRGMGAREIGLGAGLLGTIRARRKARRWLVACVLADCGDVVGTLGSWHQVAVPNRWFSLVTAAAVAAIGAGLFAADQRNEMSCP